MSTAEKLLSNSLPVLSQLEFTFHRSLKVTCQPIEMLSNTEALELGINFQQSLKQNFQILGIFLRRDDKSR